MCVDNSSVDRHVCRKKGGTSNAFVEGVGTSLKREHCDIVKSNCYLGAGGED